MPAKNFVHKKSKPLRPLVAIIMGSQSDMPTMQDGIQLLKEFGIPVHVEVVSAHRTPKRMYAFADSAHREGIKVIIAGAGGSAHLPGMVAAMTSVPVIGVPVHTKKLNGLDSLLSIVQMPKGIPVATVAIDNSTNAALLALRMLAMNDEAIYQKLDLYLKDLERQVQKMNKNISKS